MRIKRLNCISKKQNNFWGIFSRAGLDQLVTLKINFEGDPAECRYISGAVLLDVIRVDDIPNGDF